MYFGKGNATMGTRADYYKGTGEKAVWLGSSAWDGYPDGVPEIAQATTEQEFEEAVSRRISADDGTTPEKGWPWPWTDSGTTDYSYWWDGEKVVVLSFGGLIEISADGEVDKGDPGFALPQFETGNFTMGKRSGVIVVGL